MEFVCDYAKVSPAVIENCVLRGWLVLTRDVNEDVFTVEAFDPDNGCELSKGDLAVVRAKLAPYLFGR